MNTSDMARACIAEIIGNRRELSPAERDILRQLLNTPAVRNRFPSLSVDDLCRIADALVARGNERLPERGRWRRVGQRGSSGCPIRDHRPACLAGARAFKPPCRHVFRPSGRMAEGSSIHRRRPALPAYFGEAVRAAGHRARSEPDPPFDAPARR
jgi:hypothetical protein